METFTRLNLIWIAIAALTCAILIGFNIRAPYGRHARKGWGLMIPNKWGWFIMELPALLIMPLLVITSPNNISQLSWLLVFLWGYHYANRTLIFPFKLKTKDKKMPLTIVISAIFFNTVNGALNGYYLGYLAPSEQPVFNIHVGIGLAVFIAGVVMNQTSDNHLISLRQKNNEYVIPQKGLFKYISCPNHLGEMIEWIGFAIIAGNIAAISFAIWTICNLLPRALNHHTWYKKTFENYPENRKALIPFII